MTTRNSRGRKGGGSLSGLSLKDALRLARGLGCEVRHTAGEVIVHLRGHWQVRVNARRKDAPRQLTVLLNKLREPQRA